MFGIRNKVTEEHGFSAPVALIFENLLPLPVEAQIPSPNRMTFVTLPA